MYRFMRNIYVECIWYLLDLNINLLVASNNDLYKYFDINLLGYYNNYNEHDNFFRIQIIN